MQRHDENLRRALELHKRSRREFSQAHRNGIAALERRDYRALSDAVQEEASAIAQHGAALHELNETIKSRGK
jgi:hypothetical protein